MILVLGVFGAAVVVAIAATWMVQRSITRASQGPRQVDRSDLGEDQFGL